MATIYLSSLNGTDGLDVLAEFSGAKVPLPATSVPIVPTANAGNIKLGEIQRVLKFKTSHLSGSTNAPSSITASADTPTNLTVLSKGIMAADTVGRASSLGLNTRPNTAFLGQLSKEIFGSEHSADLFNNQLQLATKYVDACDNLNYKIEQNTSGVAATETVNALMLEKSERFALKYNTTVTPAPTASQVNTAVMLTTTGVSSSGVSKEVTVEIANNSTIMRMTKEKQGAFRQNTTNNTSNKYVLDQMKLDINQKRTVLKSAALFAGTIVGGIASGAPASVPGTEVAVVTSNPTTAQMTADSVSNAQVSTGVGLTVKVFPNATVATTIDSIVVVDPGVGYKIGDTIGIAAVTVAEAAIITTVNGTTTTTTSGSWATKQTSGVDDDFIYFNLTNSNFVAQALVRGKYTLTHGTDVTSKTLNSSNVWAAGAGTGVVFEVDVQGVTNSTIESVTVTTAGSGYAIDDVIKIAAGKLGTASPIIEFTVTGAMLIGGRFKNNAGLLSAFQARYIGLPGNAGTAIASYGTSANDITSGQILTTHQTATNAQASNNTNVLGTPVTLLLKAPGSTSDTINSVIISAAASGGSVYTEGDVVTLTKPTTTTSMFYGLWTNVVATSVKFTVTAAMLNGNALQVGTGGELLTAIKNAVKNGALVTVPANETYSNVALQTLQGSGAIIASITCTGATNSTITAVSLTGGGSNYKVGQLVRIPSGKMGTDSAAITITLTAAMISAAGAIQLGTGGELLTALQGSGNGELFVSSTGSDNSDGTYTAITLNSSHHGKGAEIEVVLNGPNSSNISQVKFTKHGSGYRVGDTVIVPATTLGTTSTEIEFKVTAQMLMQSGGIPLHTVSNHNTGISGTTNAGVTVNIVKGSTAGDWTTDGDGIGAEFNMTFVAGSLSSMAVVAIGSGFRNGDKITFTAASAAGKPSVNYDYTIGSAFGLFNSNYSRDVNSLFVKGDILTSAAGGGLALGGMGNSAVLTMGSASSNQTGLNAIQVAMLNETLDSPTEVPLETGDTIQSLYKITSKAGQTNSSTHPITIEYDAIFEFELKA